MKILITDTTKQILPRLHRRIRQCFDDYFCATDGTVVAVGEPHFTRPTGPEFIPACVI